jgi:hypothetical protein
MTRTIIYRSERFDVVSYGNGLAYAVHDNVNRRSMFVQDDDATAFREELEQWEALFPTTHYDEFYTEQLAIRK